MMLLIPFLIVAAPTVYLLATRKRPLSSEPADRRTSGQADTGCPPELVTRAQDLLARAEVVLLLPVGTPTFAPLPVVDPDEMDATAAALDLCAPPSFSPPPAPLPSNFYSFAANLRTRAGQLRARQAMVPPPVTPPVVPAVPGVPGVPGVNPFPSTLPQDMLDQMNALLNPRLGVTPSPLAIESLIQRIQTQFPGGFGIQISQLQAAARRARGE